MSKISILGIGCVTAAGITADEVWSNLCNDVSGNTLEYECEYPFQIKNYRNRRCDRNSKMIIYAADSAKEDASLPENVTLENDRIGTIMSTTLGSLEVNLKFAQSMLEKNIDLCSPATFTNTVANAPLGYLCMKNGYQGVSTMLLDSDCIAYSKLLLESDMADLIYSGATMLYQKDYFESFLAYEHLNKQHMAEAGVVFALSSLSTANAYCEILSTYEVNVGFNPFISQMDNIDGTKQLVQNCIQQAMKASDTETADYLILSGISPALDSVEKEIAGEALPAANILDSLCGIMGNSLSASYLVNLMIGALCLKHGQIPAKLCGSSKKPHRIMVNGYLPSGNFISTVLKSIE